MLKVSSLVHVNFHVYSSMINSRKRKKLVFKSKREEWKYKPIITSVQFTFSLNFVYWIVLWNKLIFYQDFNNFSMNNKSVFSFNKRVSFLAPVVVVEYDKRQTPLASDKTSPKHSRLHRIFLSYLFLPINSFVFLLPLTQSRYGVSLLK